MASIIGQAVLANAVVNVTANTLGFTKSMDFLQYKTTFAFAVLGQGVMKVMENFSNLEEQVEKTKEVFGSFAGVAFRLADDMASKFGVAKSEMLESFSTLGILYQGAGLGAKKSAELAASMSKLAVDAGSFYNVDTDKALHKIMSGLTGMSRPLREFGIVITEVKTHIKALEMGLVKPGKELNETQKLLARNALITEGLARAQGDAERSSGRWAWQVKALWGNLEQFGVAIGGILSPLATPLLGFLNSAIQLFTGLVGPLKWVTEGLAEIVSEFAQSFAALGGMIANAPVITEILQGWGLIFEVMGEKIRGAYTVYREFWQFMAHNHGGLPTQSDALFDEERMNQDRDMRNQQMQAEIEQENKIQEIMNQKRKPAQHSDLVGFSKNLQQGVFGNKSEQLLRQIAENTFKAIQQKKTPNPAFNKELWHNEIPF